MEPCPRGHAPCGLWSSAAIPLPGTTMACFFMRAIAIYLLPWALALRVWSLHNTRYCRMVGRGAMIFTQSKFLILFVIVAVLPGFGQFTSTSSSDKTRNAPYLDDKGAPLDQPSTPLKIVKMKGVVENVDLDKRTITIYSGKKHRRSIELTFPQPNGLEQVKTSKKTSKILGKKRLALEHC